MNELRNLVLGELRQRGYEGVSPEIVDSIVNFVGVGEQPVGYAIDRVVGSKHNPRRNIEA